MAIKVFEMVVICIASHKKASINIWYHESQISIATDTCIIGSTFSTMFKEVLEVCNQFSSHLNIKITVTIVNVY